ncbi:hypothetical protein ACFQ51_20680 [Streptomyces kaempferi]
MSGGARPGVLPSCSPRWRCAALVVPSATPAAAAAAVPVTVTFNAGADQPFTVPSGVTQLTVTATGAAGQNGPSGGTGGNGATVTGTVTVPPSTTTLYVNVGTGGAQRRIGDYGRCGGGSSDVRTCSSAGPGCTLTGVPGTDPRLIVAGGGGGGGSGVPTNFLNPEATGGDAGITGVRRQQNEQRPGRRRRNPDSGGAGGAVCPGSGGTSGTPGTGGAGGNGGGNFGAGGGGGGWFGGGGGGGCNRLSFPPAFGPGGGGGASNRVPTGGTSAPAAGWPR